MGKAIVRKSVDRCNFGGAGQVALCSLMYNYILLLAKHELFFLYADNIANAKLSRMDKDLNEEG